jgi:serine-type D-Ala-D-Ala carboxypeptidase (penicillin-binding protein 5/6)
MKTRVGSHKLRYATLILFIGVAYFVWCLLKPLPALQPESANSTIETKTAASALAWPSSQAAVSVVGADIIETNQPAKPVPTASTAKIITALMVLNKKPLKVGEQGPIITLGPNDVDIYQKYVAQDGSVVPVLAGEQISEYQALQTVMLPSANNMADSLAIWSYGSLGAYAEAANAYLKQQGLSGSHVGSDASGLAANSTSTASDLAKLGSLAMQNSVLAQIVGQSSATGIPIVGTIKNVNDLIGLNGIVGVKTGNSNEAGGAFVSASKTAVNNKPVVITTAVVNAPSLFASMKDSLPLIKSAQTNFSVVEVASKNQVAGKYSLPWGGSVDAISAKDLSLSFWNGSTVTASATLQEIPANSTSGSLTGKITIKKSALNDSKSVPLVLKNTPAQPSLWWRLTHPIN